MLEEYDDILSVGCLNQILGLGKNTTLKLLKTGEIPAKKVGHQWRILKKDVIQYLTKYSNSLRE